MYESVKTIQDIRDEHIDVLRDFGVKVTSQIVRTIETKTTEIAIENYCRILIIKRLEQEELEYLRYLLDIQRLLMQYILII